MNSKLNKDIDQIFLDKIDVLRQNGWSLMLLPGRHSADQEREDTKERIEKMIEILSKTKSKSTSMTGFILYDIENNKIRSYISNYLIKKGCMRVQKSVFFCNLPRKEWLQIKNNLSKINDIYTNQDSIFLLPVSKDNINGATCVGQQFIHELQEEKPSVIFL